MNINEMIKQSMLAKDTRCLSVFRALKASFAKTEMMKGRKTPELSDDERTSIIRKEISQRHDASIQFIKGNRKDLASLEDEESQILTALLPKQASIELISTTVTKWINIHQATSRKQMGIVMQSVKAELGDSADPKEISTIALKALS